MNLFVTHRSPMQCAVAHCDVHLNKMVTECAQLLSTAHYVVTGEQVGYRPTHKNHPCAIWVRESAANYRWAFVFYCCLLVEYTYRTGKHHKSGQHRKALRLIPPLPEIGLTAFAQAVDDQHRHQNPHIAYRRHIRAKLLEWPTRERPVRTTYTKRPVPRFITETP
jgi:hypothetical protein